MRLRLRESYGVLIALHPTAVLAMRENFECRCLAVVISLQRQLLPV